MARTILAIFVIQTMETMIDGVEPSTINVYSLRNNNYLHSKILDEYCHKKFDALVVSMHNFSDCIMQNSLSYEACSTCGTHYRSYEETKGELETDARLDENNKTCAEALHDTRISLIDYEERAPVGLWKNGSCDRCYVETRDGGGGGKDQLHPDYAHFQRLFDEYRKCTIEFRDAGSSNLCGNCSQSYGKFIEFFHESVHVESPFLHCLDAKQKINATVNEWRGVFGCNRLIKSDRFATFALSIFILILPLPFYMAVYVRSDAHKEEYDLVHRSSFQEEDADMEEDDEEEEEETVASTPAFY